MRVAIPMRMRTAVGLGILVLSVLLLVACGNAATPAPTAPTAVPPTVTAVPPTQPAASPTLAPTDTPAPEPTATVTEAPVAAASVDSTNCVTCHTSEETLQQLAVEEAPAEKLSEGEG